jgi:hypothetical protein
MRRLNAEHKYMERRAYGIKSAVIMKLCPVVIGCYNKENSGN